MGAGEGRIRAIFVTNLTLIFLCRDNISTYFLELIVRIQWTHAYIVVVLSQVCRRCSANSHYSCVVVAINTVIIIIDLSPPHPRASAQCSWKVQIPYLALLLHAWLLFLLIKEQVSWWKTSLILWTQMPLCVSILWPLAVKAANAEIYLKNT